MIPFRDQFIKCGEAGVIFLGPIMPFRLFPELLPLPFGPAAKAIAKKLKKDPDFGLRFNHCGKFGGKCGSDNKKCQQLRKSP